MAEAEHLLAAGCAEAALLRAWSTAEATVRLLMEEEGLSCAEVAPSALLKEAVMQGVMARDAYHCMMRVLPYRNAVAHGFAVQDFEPQLVHDLLIVLRQMLQEALTPAR
jgi:hypothetical protein